MKDNKKLTIIVCLILVILIVGIIIIPKIITHKRVIKEYYEANIYELESTNYYNDNRENYHIATNQISYEAYLKIRNIELSKKDYDDIEDKDFNHFSYILILIHTNNCGENVEYNGTKVNKDKTRLTFNFSAVEICEKCESVYKLYEIKIPKSQSSYFMEIDWDIEESNDCRPVVAYKPILYIYPEEKTEITINFAKEENLTTTYPKFEEEWKITAYPNGDLYDKDDKYYYALYWEEKDNSKIDFSEGFYVSSFNAINFLEEKLTVLGLNPKERNEFIMYWLPILEKNKHSLVYFEVTEQLQNKNELIINPQPDTLIRIRMHVKKVKEKTNIKEQQLIKQERAGYTAIEWGGVIHN